MEAYEASRLGHIVWVFADTMWELAERRQGGGLSEGTYGHGSHPVYIVVALRLISQVETEGRLC